ncbi:hypothetical protein [Paenibacillus sp. 1001270B_150601_E10]|uniref:hypothetical protein n=1 Tax=Paenibacillus sp. 1001270B_150601_E10 TaxID=2787079 RepID=UPI002B4C0344|nr:hypothetical protein [Paenibacillus sp. 1001270B_150601_E10]
MKNKEMESLIVIYLNAYNAFDIDGMTSVLHEDVVFRNISNGVMDTEAKGIDPFRELASNRRRSFPKDFKP